jgi:Mg2+ and Co2+ transporter CorA
MEPFLGSVGVRVLYYLVDGNPLYEVKGTQFWGEQLSLYFSRLQTLQDKYSSKLDEKRNFWSFILTIVSILQFPIGAMTGYWGLNYSGIDELSTDWGNGAGGIKFFWIVAGIIYFVMMAYLMHTKVILAAS